MPNDKKPYGGPGKYVAVCNTTNFDGHYAVPFTIPDTEEWATVSASWYFLNVVDFFSCVEDVYPAAVFSNLSHS